MEFRIITTDNEYDHNRMYNDLDINSSKLILDYYAANLNSLARELLDLVNTRYPTFTTANNYHIVVFNDIVVIVNEKNKHTLFVMFM
jgi:hypothetical protein